MAAMDYLSPAEVKRLIPAGAVLPPATSECLLPAEVAAAVPVGMVMMVGYGPEANFAEKPKAPKWTTKVRYKTTASLMRGISGMMGSAGNDGPAQAPDGQQPPKKKKRGFGLGDLIGAVPH
jgi:hypothetical protein